MYNLAECSTVLGTSTLLPGYIDDELYSDQVAQVVRERASRFTYPSFHAIRRMESKIPAIEGRHQAWQRIVREKTGRQDFDINQMIAWAVRYSSNYHSNVPIPCDLRAAIDHERYSLLSDKMINVLPGKTLLRKPHFDITSRLHNLETANHPFINGYTFLFFSRDIMMRIKPSDATIKSWAFPCPMPNFMIYNLLHENGMTGEYLANNGEKVTLCGHDLIHNWSFILSDDLGNEDDEIPAFTNMLQESYVNRPKMADSEHLALMINQEIFLDLRKQHAQCELDILKDLIEVKDNWFNMLSRFQDVLPRSPRFIGQAELIMEVLRAEAEFHFSNYSPIELLKQNDPKKWGEIFRDAQPQFASDSFQYRNAAGVIKTTSCAELTIKYYDNLQEWAKSTARGQVPLVRY